MYEFWTCLQLVLAFSISMLFTCLPAFLSPWVFVNRLDVPRVSGLHLAQSVFLKMSSTRTVLDTLSVDPASVKKINLNTECTGLGLSAAGHSILYIVCPNWAFSSHTPSPDRHARDHTIAF